MHEESVPHLSVREVSTVRSANNEEREGQLGISLHEKRCQSPPIAGRAAYQNQQNEVALLRLQRRSNKARQVAVVIPRTEATVRPE